MTVSSAISAHLRQLLQHVAEQAHWTAAALAEQGLLELFNAQHATGQSDWSLAAQRARRELLARELLHAQLLEELQARLHAAGLAAVLIKGEALALTLYPEPATRPRHDVDVWIRPAERSAVEEVLRTLGGQPMTSAWGRWIQPEQLWRFVRGRATVGIDLHWQFCSRPALLGALDFAEVLSRSSAWRGSTELGLRMPAHIDSLLLACIHRRAHHRGGERWIWLVDIALLWVGLSADQREQAVERAIAGGVAALLADGLKQAARLLPEHHCNTLQARLQQAAEQEVSRFLLRAPRRYSDLRFDLRHSTGRRLAVLRDYLLPRADYMYQRYADVRPAWLPWLYLRRLLRRLP